MKRMRRKKKVSFASDTHQRYCILAAGSPTSLFTLETMGKLDTIICSMYIIWDSYRMLCGVPKC